ncbi:MAG: PTS system fructose-specific IIC component [Rhodothermales bacterium]|jgi:PTS system fructose-specific IIC component
MAKLASHLVADRVVALQAQTRKAAIDELLALVATHHEVADNAEFARLIHEREAGVSTAIGFGVAIPHAPPPGLKKLFVYVGFSKDGIDYEASDGHLVHLVFLVGKANQREYLGLLQQIAWLLRNDSLRNQLYDAPDAQTLYSLLSQH